MKHQQHGDVVVQSKYFMFTFSEWISNLQKYDDDGDGADGVVRHAKRDCFYASD